MEFRTLGPFEVLDRGRPVSLGGLKQRALLALLVLNANRFVARDQIVDGIWGDDPPATASPGVKVYVSRLRKLLAQNGEAPRVVTRSHGYMLEVDPNLVDLDRFEQLLRAGRGQLAAGDADSARKTLRKALSLWRGPALADLAGAVPFARDQRERLEELRLAALEDRIEADLAVGRHDDAIGELESVIREHPYRERPRAQLMRALYGSGRQADALAVYRDSRRLLRDELGLEPSNVLTDVERAILAHDPSLDVPATSDRPAAVTCPFKGLAAFEFGDGEYFFGRERLLSELVARLVEVPLVGLVGSSGSGKSSLLRAGLVHALSEGALPSSEGWRHVIIRPGERPYEELASHVGSSATGALERLGAGERLVLAVDQLEELFSLCNDGDERSRFVDFLVELARDRDRRAVVLLALRADFYGRFARYADFAEILARSHVLVGPLTEQELERAIVGPAERGGLRVEPELVAKLVSDVRGEPGALPLLSTTLLDLWQRRTNNALSLAEYKRFGGVSTAVERLAERAYARLDEDQRKLAAAIFLRLVSGGTGESAVSRRVSRDELPGGDALAGVLDTLADSRLLVVDEGDVEVAHEALLREWPRLRGWLEEDAAGRRLYGHLITHARDWDVGGRVSTDLYRGVRLAAALEWAENHRHELNEVEREYLEAGRNAAEDETRRQRRANTRLRALLIGAVVLLALAVAAGVVALVQRGHARAAENAALAERLATQSLALPNLDQALLVARESVALDDSAITRGALLAALERSPSAIGIGRGDGAPLVALAISPDGRLLATGATDGTVSFFDARTMRPVGKTFRANLGVSALAFARDYVVVGQQNTSRLAFVDPRTHLRLRTLDILNTPNEVAVSPDGTTLAAALSLNPRVQPPRVVLYDLASGRERGPGLTGLVGGRLAGFTSDGRFVVVCTASHTLVLDARTLRVVRRFDGGGLLALAARADVAVTARPHGPVRIVDLRSGHRQALAYRGLGAIEAVALSSDGERAAAALSTGDVTTWRVARPLNNETLRGLADTAESVAFAPDGTLYAAGHDSTVVSWDPSGRRGFGKTFDIASSAGRDTPLAAVSPDGSSFAVSPLPKRLQFWSARGLKPRAAPFDAPVGRVNAIAYGHGSRTLAVVGSRGAAILRGQSTERILRETGDPFTTSVAFDGSDRRVVTGRRDDFANVYAVPSGKILQELPTPGAVRDAAFSSDGRFIATASKGGDVVLWNAGSGLRVRSFKADDLSATAVAFSPHGDLLATGGDGGAVRLWETATGKPASRALSVAHGPITSLAFDPKGDLVVAGSEDGKVYTWDVQSRQEVGRGFPSSGAVVAWPVPDGKRILDVSSTGTGDIWSIDARVWKADACRLAGRDLTREEWREFLPSRTYEAVCR
jgi:DNA-binding SARP family transcriptional activator/WD40 repeat protein